MKGLRPPISSADVDVFETHGARFSSYVRPSRSACSCAPGGSTCLPLRGAPHRPSHEEVICCVGGELTIALDGTEHQPAPRRLAYVPAGSEIRLHGGPGGGAALTTSLACLSTISHGSRLRPP